MSDYYSPQMLANLRAYYDEIRFNANGDGTGIKLDCDADFSIRRGAYDRYYLKNDGKKNVFFDVYAVEPSQSAELERSSMFIHDPGNFLLGFDPMQQDIWRLNPKSERGLEICAENFTKTFQRKQKRVGVENLNFTIQASEFVGIYGNSGTGKTTLIESMIAPKEKAGLWKRIRDCFFKGKNHRSGKILFDGEDVSVYSNEIAYLPQHIDLPENLQCKDLLELAMIDRGDKDVLSDRSVIDKTLSLCTLDNAILDTPCKSLSGGQKRRLALAMALLKKRVRLLILDEPTTGLDIENELLVMNTLRRISRHGTTVVAVTHSVASCRLFDRVLVLRKTFAEKGAELCFKARWIEDSFQNSVLASLSDSDRLSFLANPNSGLLLDSMEPKSYVWPYELIHSREKQETKPKTKPFRTIRRNVSEFFSKTRWTQAWFWFKNSLALILAEWRSLVTFSLLSLCCVAVIQCGIVGVSSTQNMRLVAMMTICGPWLCATYSALFLSELLRFFAWEKFSGLHSFNFILGIWGAQIVPALLLSLIFSFGIMKRPNHEIIVNKTILYLATACDFCHSAGKFNSAPVAVSKNDSVSDSALQTVLSWCPIKENEKNKLKNSLEDATIGECWCNTLENQNAEYTIDSERCQDGPNRFFRVWFAMLIVCLIGSAIGIFAEAVFIKAKNATIFLVVLFIAFLMFGRLFANHNLQEPLARLSELKKQPDWGIRAFKTGDIFPLFVSFISYSRYAFNFVVYPIWQIAVRELLPMLGFLLLSLGGTTLSLSNKSKIWKFLSR